MHWTRVRVELRKVTIRKWHIITAVVGGAIICGGVYLVVDYLLTKIVYARLDLGQLVGSHVVFLIQTLDQILIDYGRVLSHICTVRYKTFMSHFKELVYEFFFFF